MAGGSCREWEGLGIHGGGVGWCNYSTARRTSQTLIQKIAEIPNTARHPHSFHLTPELTPS